VYISGVRQLEGLATRGSSRLRVDWECWFGGVCVCGLCNWRLRETEVPPALLMGSALASNESVLELAETGSVQYGQSSRSLLTEATPAAPLLPKSCRVNPIHMYICVSH